MFDILKCSCKIFPCPGGESCVSVSECHGWHARCDCPPSQRIPEEELGFIEDQRSGIFKMIMVGVDKVDSVNYEKDCRNKEKAAKRARHAEEEEARRVKSKTEEKVKEADDEQQDIGVDNIHDDSNASNNEDFNCNVLPNPILKRTTISLGPYIGQLAKYDISNRAGAALWNSALQALVDAGYLNTDKPNEVPEELTVDQFKISREKTKQGKVENKSHNESNQGLQCIGCDGKIDKKTKITAIKEIGGEEVVKNTTGSEEHLTYTAEPSGKYLDHSVLSDGSGVTMAKDFLDKLELYNSLESLQAVLLDGCKTNTGWKTGLFVTLERELKRQLILLSCMLHANELPLRELLVKLDGGGTSGPTTFSGELGTEASEPHHLASVEDFGRIPCFIEELEEEVLNDLSRDQRLLYQYCLAVGSGHLSPDVAVQVAGPLNHARWLTLATRILQLYTRTDSPSMELQKLTTFIVQVYGPMWFSIRYETKSNIY